MPGCGCLTRGGGGACPRRSRPGPEACLVPGRDGTPRRIAVLRTRSAGRPPGDAVTGQTACPARPATMHTLTDQRSGTMPVTLASVPVTPCR